MVTTNAKRRTSNRLIKVKAKDSVKSLITSELSYLKKAQILMLGNNKRIAELSRYFYDNYKKARITILSFSKKELLGAINATSRFGSIRYAYSKDVYTGLSEDEFGLIVSYGTFDNIGNNRAISILRELYRISKPNGIVIIIGNNIDYLYKHYNKSNFSSCEIIENKGLRYLKLVKVNEISLLPQ
ncbi:MAG: methyltransferase domain-containing protein [Methanothrix sp.]